MHAGAVRHWPPPVGFSLETVMKQFVLSSLLYLSVAMPGIALAAADDTQQQYRESSAGARSTLNADLAQCRRVAADERGLCSAQARAVYKKALAEAVAHQRNTPQARVDARIASAAARASVPAAGSKPRRCVSKRRGTRWQTCRSRRGATGPRKRNARLTTAHRERNAMRWPVLQGRPA